LLSLLLCTLCFIEIIDYYIIFNIYQITFLISHVVQLKKVNITN